MTEGRGSRGVRAALFAVVCVLLAAAGHSLMSGQSLPLWVVVGALAGVFCAAWPLTVSERDVASVTAVAVAIQAVLHVALTVSQLTTGAATGHAHHNSMPGMSMSTDHAMGTGSLLGMFAVHLLAAFLSGLWLAYGERAAFRVLHVVARRVSTAILLSGSPVTATPQSPGQAGRTQPAQLIRLLFLVHSLISRGPPARVAVS